MIGRRYQLLDRLGSGGMGAVYRAYDRLSRIAVALKQVTAPEIELGDGGRRFTAHTFQLTGGSEERLLLAREFRLLASLRHPNIISVLDYGFDEVQRPYYAMEVVERPHTLVEAGRELPTAQRIELLIQMLQALAYLHRRGVLHRDVKPSNVMVDSGKVKLVDFGISESQGMTVRQLSTPTGVAGTIPYLAPELLHGEPASRAADLWAVGVMAYELFTGRHPYDGPTMPAMMLKIVTELPALSTAEFDARLIPVMERLLAKNPAERYSEARDVINDLSAAARLPSPVETADIRDSFLQAARLVGRRRELTELGQRLEAAGKGRGSVLLLGGESGVGKTRLLEELRTLSLVQGALVVAGQAVRDGGSPYQVWRQPLRWLCLLTEIDDADAAVLKSLVPDVAELLDRDVPDAPAVDPQSAQQRLLAVIARLFAQLDKPLTVVLEDLHWAGSESLAVLARLQQVVEERSLLIVGSFRDDERPGLAAELPGADELKLQRLDPESIAELSESMLGDVGRQRQILDLLQRETEGNLFFLVEVVRALAEEAGRLDRIDTAHLPAQVSTGGIRKIIRRRLNQVPPEARPMLDLAAVTGREIDVNVLRALEPEMNLGQWLTICANVAVLEVQGKTWRFTHDRLRETLLLDLPPSRKRALHRRIAAAIESLYGDAPGHVAALAHHWRQAADVGDEAACAKAVDYQELAARQALDSCANQTAEELLTAALDQLATLPITPERQRQEVRLRIDLGGTYLMSKGHTAPEVAQAFGRARVLCQQIGDGELLQPILLGLWRHHVVRGELPTSRGLAEQLLAQTARTGDPTFRVLAEYAMGTNLLFQGEPEPAWSHFRRSLDVYEGMSDDGRQELAGTTFALGQHPTVAALDYGAWALWLLGFPAQSAERIATAVELADELAHSYTQTFARTLVAWVAQLRHDVEATAAAAATSAAMASELGFPYFGAVSLIHGGWARALTGEADAGIGQIQKVLERLRALGSELFRPYFLSLLAEAYGAAGTPEDGLRMLDEALQVAERSGEGWWEPEVLRLRGELLLALPQPDEEEAETSFLKALHRARFRRARALELRAALSLFRLWQGRDEVRRSKARQTLERLLDGFSEGLESPDLEAARRLLGRTA